MSFCNEDKARTNNLHAFKKYSSQRILVEFLKMNSKREGLDTLLKDMQNKKHRPKS